MKTKLIILALFITSIFYACSSNSDSPKNVAEKFLKAMEERKYEDAMVCSTRSTQKLLTQLRRLEELTGENDAVKPNKVTIVSEDIQGDKAVVYFKEEGNNLQQQISLKRVVEDDKKVWKVDLLKEELQLNRDAGGDTPVSEDESSKKSV